MKRINQLFAHLIPTFLLYSFTLLPLAPASITRINTIIEQSHCHTGVAVYSCKDNKNIYSKNAELLFAPASCEKLFLAAAAIDILGVDYCFETTLFTDGTIEEDTLHGNLFLKGSGDPSLTTQDVEALIKALADLNIQNIKGNFYIDYYDFDTIAFAPGTTYDNIGEPWFGPIGALMLDRKAALVNPCNNAEYVQPSRLENLYYAIEPLLKKTMNNYTLTLQGTIIADHLPQNIIPLITHTSQPLSTLLHKVIKESDNIYADCIFKKIGSVTSGNPGSWKNGAQAVISFLSQHIAIAPHEIRIADGSGLSRYNLVSPDHIIKVLTWAYTNHGAEFIALLPIAGLDGTLVQRMIDIQGTVKAKTGTMGGISSLSGYVEKDDTLYVFSIINNSYLSESMYNPPCKSDIEDAICRALVEDIIH